MTAPERFAEKSDSLLQRGRRPYMTHSDLLGETSLQAARGKSSGGAADLADLLIQIVTEGYLAIRHQRRVVLAAVDLDFRFGGLALTFDASLSGGRLACLALEDAALFPEGAPEVLPDPLLETVLACRSTVKLSPTPVLPDVGSTVTNSPTTEVVEIVNRKNPKVLSLYTSSLRGFPLASIPEPGVCEGGRRFGGFKPGRL